MTASIFLRMTEDWDNVSLDGITFYKNLELIRATIRMWDRIFPVRYFKYRSQIKDIALRQWPLPHITELPQEIGDNDWFIPSDDDDWFHHDLPKFLEAQNEEYVYWGSVVNMTYTKYNVHKWFMAHDVIGSNNYAIKGSLMKRADDNQRLDLIHNHPHSIEIARGLGATIGEHKDKILSCYNCHPGSISALHRLLEQHGMIKGAIPAGEPLKKYPKWFNPSYGELISIVDGLKRQILLL